jgi:alkylhydroperoxidase family enzyme
MPRLEPIPFDDLNPASRQIIDDGFGEGLYSTQVPLQIFAYRTAQLAGVHQARTHTGEGSLLGGRIIELIRIRSAQLGECQPCMQSRKHDSITDDDVACLLAPVRDDLNDQERMAVEFLDLLSADHHAIDREFYERLAEVFTGAQIVELGFVCANTMGLHRFLHTLDLYGTDPPVIPFDPSEVDQHKPGFKPTAPSPTAS